jgi:hypothetical protein
MNLVLSPTLHAICNRSSSYRCNYVWKTLNVCNVIRSLMFVLLVLTALPVAAVCIVLHSVAQLGVVMWALHTWSPYAAMDFLVDALRDQNFIWSYYGTWYQLFSTILSGAIIFIGTLACALGALFTIGYYLVRGLERLARVDATDRLLTKVVGPMEVVGEYIASKHSRFCVNINSQVKTTYAQELRDDMEYQYARHWHALQVMSTGELLASIERNRAILSRYA